MPQPLSLQRQAEAHDGQMCSFKGVKPAPQIFFYRNKDMMSIGPSIHGCPGVVGHVAGKLKGGQRVYVGPKYIINMKKKHKEIVSMYQTFLRQSPRGEYHPGCQGYWSSIAMRSNQEGDTMCTVGYREVQTPQDDYEEVKEEIRQYFQQGPGQDLALTSLYIRPSPYSSWGNREADLVCGASHIYEHVLGHKFRISPDSFFQTNTPAAEVLYSTIREYVKLSSARTVIDVCCGTGIIGILTSDLVDNVFGADIAQQAIEDAHVNAEINGVKNAEFLCTKAHRALRDILPNRNLPGDAIAVVNPNRSGVSVKVVNALRMCKQIRHVIYISCKPRGKPVTNFVDLIVPENDKVQGEPFLPVEAVGVDMFPQTLHSELVVLFQR